MGGPWGSTKIDNRFKQLLSDVSTNYIFYLIYVISSFVFFSFHLIFSSFVVLYFVDSTYVVGIEELQRDPYDFAEIMATFEREKVRFSPNQKSIGILHILRSPLLSPSLFPFLSSFLTLTSVALCDIML